MSDALCERTVCLEIYNVGLFLPNFKLHDAAKNQIFIAQTLGDYSCRAYLRLVVIRQQSVVPKSDDVINVIW